MNSRIIGNVEFESSVPVSEFDDILTNSRSSDYSEFVRGDWRYCVLMNPTGKADDGLMRRYHGRALNTPIVEMLPRLMNSLSMIFNLDLVRWLRVFIFGSDGLLFPHRDFLEVDRAYRRLHLPIKTNPSAMHSEEDTVFHMREGEIWYLDTTSIHSACNFSQSPRVSVVLDFPEDLSDEQMTRVSSRANLPPRIINRPRFTPTESLQFISRWKAIDRSNFAEMAWELAALHFQREISCTDVFTMAEEVCLRSADREMLSRALAMRQFFIERRLLGQRFEFPLLREPLTSQIGR
jgi:hypothetical protein